MTKVRLATEAELSAFVPLVTANQLGGYPKIDSGTGKIPTAVLPLSANPACVVSTSPPPVDPTTIGPTLWVQVTVDGSNVITGVVDMFVVGKFS